MLAEKRAISCGSNCDLVGGRNSMGQSCQTVEVGFGSWLCENAKPLNRGRTSYSSRATLASQRASEFNLEAYLKNIILRRVLIFEFSHNQGQKRRSSWRPTTSGLPR
jgi:hypothetical protein